MSTTGEISGLQHGQMC